VRLSALDSSGAVGEPAATTRAFVTGAVRFSTGDLPGATAEWRRLVDDAPDLVALLPDAMSEAFDRTGGADLAERVDAMQARASAELNGVTLGHVHMARRAHDRGDRARAIDLAARAVRAWSGADAAVPAVDEMQRMLDRLDAR
jgi:hypothetical protein